MAVAPHRRSADSSVVDRELGAHTLIIREFAVSDLHFATVHGLRTDLAGCKIPKFFGGRMPPDLPISFCTSRGSSYKRSVPMLCPSNDDVLATPLA